MSGQFSSSNEKKARESKGGPGTTSQAAEAAETAPTYLLDFLQKQKSLSFAARIKLCVAFANLIAEIHRKNGIHLKICADQVQLQILTSSSQSVNEAILNGDFELKFRDKELVVIQQPSQTPEDQNPDVQYAISDEQRLAVGSEPTTAPEVRADSPSAGFKSDVYSSIEVILRLLGITQPWYNSTIVNKRYNLETIDEYIPLELQNTIKTFFLLMRNDKLALRPSSEQIYDFFSLVEKYTLEREESRKADKLNEINSFLSKCLIERNAALLGITSSEAMNETKYYELLFRINLFIKKFFNIDIFQPISEDPQKKQIRQFILDELDALSAKHNLQAYSKAIKDSKFVKRYFLSFKLSKIKKKFQFYIEDGEFISYELADAIRNYREDIAQIRREYLAVSFDGLTLEQKKINFQQAICKCPFYRKYRRQIDEVPFVLSFTDKTGQSKKAPYQYVKIIGRGGHGIVVEYELEQSADVSATPRDSSTIAVKILTDEGLQDIGSLSHEADLLNVSKSTVIYAADEKLIAMERIDGKDLFDFSNEERKRKSDKKKIKNFRQRIDLCLQFSLALANLHARGIIHQDLKPENVFLNEVVIKNPDKTDPKDQAPVSRLILTIMDFGLSCRRDDKLQDQEDELQAISNAPGTSEYKAKEICTGKTSPKSDIYSSVGVILILLGAFNPVARRNRNKIEGKKKGEEYFFDGIEENIPREIYLPVKHFLELMQKPDAYSRPSSTQMVTLFQLLYRYALLEDAKPEDGKSEDDIAAEKNKITEEINRFVLGVRLGRMASEFIQKKSSDSKEQQYNAIKSLFQEYKIDLPDYTKASSGINIFLNLMMTTESAIRPSDQQIVQFFIFLSQKFQELEEENHQPKGSLINEHAFLIALEKMLLTLMEKPQAIQKDTNPENASKQAGKIQYTALKKQIEKILALCGAEVELSSLPNYDDCSELQPAINIFFSLFSNPEISIKPTAQQTLTFLQLLSEYVNTKEENKIQEINFYIIENFILNAHADACEAKSAAQEVAEKRIEELSTEDDEGLQKEAKEASSVAEKIDQFLLIQRTNDFLKKSFQVDLFKQSDNESTEAIREQALAALDELFESSISEQLETPAFLSEYILSFQLPRILKKFAALGSSEKGMMTDNHVQLIAEIQQIVKQLIGLKEKINEEKRIKGLDVLSKCILDTLLINITRSGGEPIPRNLTLTEFEQLKLFKNINDILIKCFTIDLFSEPSNEAPELSKIRRNALSKLEESLPRIRSSDDESTGFLHTGIFEIIKNGNDEETIDYLKTILKPKIKCIDRPYRRQVSFFRFDNEEKKVLFLKRLRKMLQTEFNIDFFQSYSAGSFESLIKKAALAIMEDCETTQYMQLAESSKGTKAAAFCRLLMNEEVAASSIADNPYYKHLNR